MTAKLLRQMAIAATLLGSLSLQAMAQETVDVPKGDTGATPAAPKPQAPPPPPTLGPRAQAAAPQAAPQGGAPGAPPLETLATFKGWLVQCAQVPAQGDQPAGKACFMTRTATHEKEKNIGVNMIAKRAKTPDGKIVTEIDLMAPIGVYIPTGVAIEIDGSALPESIKFVRCTPQACLALGQASADTLQKLKKGKMATLYVYDRPGNGYPIKFTLDGFGEGLATLDKQLTK